MKCENIKCGIEFTGRSNKIYCSPKCARYIHKKNARIRKILSNGKLNNEEDINIFNMGRSKVTFNEWIIRCNKKYNNYYDYSKVQFSKSQKTFENLKYKNKLYFDFYLPKYNLCIEFDGIQHHKAFNFFGGELKLKDTMIKDNIKNIFCINNGIKLLRISHSINYKTRDKIKDKIYTKIINYLNDI